MVWKRKRKIACWNVDGGKGGGREATGKVRASEPPKKKKKLYEAGRKEGAWLPISIYLNGWMDEMDEMNSELSSYLAKMWLFICLFAYLPTLFGYVTSLGYLSRYD